MLIKKKGFDTHKIALPECEKIRALLIKFSLHSHHTECLGNITPNIVVKGQYCGFSGPHTLDPCFFPS